MSLLIKLERFCAKQERCTEDVIKKMTSLKIPSTQHQILLKSLKESGFLNEERFIESFVNGKLRQNKWGKQKIKHALIQKKIQQPKIDDALQKIDKEEYMAILKSLYEKKLNSLTSEKNEFLKKQKAMHYLSSKGFYTTEIMELLGA